MFLHSFIVFSPPVDLLYAALASRSWSAQELTGIPSFISSKTADVISGCLCPEIHRCTHPLASPSWRSNRNRVTPNSWSLSARADAPDVRSLMARNMRPRSKLVKCRKLLLVESYGYDANHG